MEESTSTNRLWILFAVVTITVIVATAITWSLQHPLGTNWDETVYLNQSQIDTQRLSNGMLLRLAGRLIVKTPERPPAYRLLALPFLAVFGFHTTLVRIVSLMCYCLSAGFIYLATRQCSTVLGGVIAVLFFCLSPQIVSASIWFSTEGPLYLAVSATLYFLFSCWRGATESRANWIGLGLAVGLGFLSKSSFLVIALPLLVYWFALNRWAHIGIPKVQSQMKAILLAMLLAVPWWLLNVKGAMAYSKYARDFVSNSLGSPSIETYGRWLVTVCQALLGYGLTTLVVLLVIVCLRIALAKKERILDSFQKAALGACACAGVPIVLVQLSGTNHLLRHISPAVIPLAIAAGILAVQTRFVLSAFGATLTVLLFLLQLGMMMTPVFVPNTRLVDSGLVNGSLPWRIMTRHEQWDWSPVQRLSQNCDVHAPKVSYLGAGQGFNAAAIEFPWAAKAMSTHMVDYDYPEVKWLWRHEQGPPDWQKIMDAAAQSDILITAPHYVGRKDNHEDLDNQYNSEFVDRLSRDPRFRGPIQFEMGRFEPIEVVVFWKSSLACPASTSVVETPAVQK